MQVSKTSPMHQKRERISFWASVPHSLWQTRHEKGKKHVLTYLIVLSTTKNSPSHHKAVCVLAQLRVLCYERKSKSRWQAEKLNKQFWLKPQTNKWAMSPNPRLWHSSLHRHIFGFLHYRLLFHVLFGVFFNVKASMQCERWQRALQESGCGRIASS